MNAGSETDSTVRTEGFIEVVGGAIAILSDSGQPAAAPVPIGQDPLIVGRAESCDLAVADSQMSTVHCSLTASPEGICLIDEGSLNGTWIGSVRLKPKSAAYLTATTNVRAGRTWFEVRITGHEPVPISGAIAYSSLVGRSQAMGTLYAQIQRAAPTPHNVLITGETGSGKELVAQALHEASGRRGKLVTIDCGSMPASLIEAALFGHVKGAFTGASERVRSPFLEAVGGTVFIDELGELPVLLQPKLLRALEAKQIQAVGSTKWEDIDVRVIAATRRDLHHEMNVGNFRSDLFFRFVRRINVPPLREHPEDIPDLVARFFLADLNDPGALSRIDAVEWERLKRFDWPGNVRELRNTVLSAQIESDGGPIRFAEILNPQKGGHHLGDRISASQSFAVQKDELVTAFTREYFTRLHAETGGNISAMSRRSGLSRGQVGTYVARLGLKDSDE